MKQELSFNWKYKDYELRACPARLVRFDNESNETINLIMWKTNPNGKKTCFSLAYWIKNSEGYDLKFVGNRPFECIEPEDIRIIWKAIGIAQKTLDAWFEIQRLEE